MKSVGVVTDPLFYEPYIRKEGDKIYSCRMCRDCDREIVLAMARTSGPAVNMWSHAPRHDCPAKLTRNEELLRRVFE